MRLAAVALLFAAAAANDAKASYLLVGALALIAVVLALAAERAR